MQALSNQYYSFLNAKEDKSVKTNYKLYVKKLTEGSVIIDLCEKCPETMEIITPMIAEFSTYLVNTLDYLSGKDIKNTIYKYTKLDWLNFKKFLEPIANISGNKIGFLGVNFGNVTVNTTYNNTEASACQNKCDKEIKAIENGDNNIIKEKFELQLYQAYKYQRI